MRKKIQGGMPRTLRWRETCGTSSIPFLSGYNLSESPIPVKIGIWPKDGQCIFVFRQGKDMTESASHHSEKMSIFACAARFRREIPAMIISGKLLIEITHQTPQAP
jgi:hypothetical protein